MTPNAGARRPQAEGGGQAGATSPQPQRARPGRHPAFPLGPPDRKGTRFHYGGPRGWPFIPAAPENKRQSSRTRCIVGGPPSP